MSTSTLGYIFDYGGTIDTCGCHWGRFIWHAYEECRVPVDWKQFSRAYVHAERTLGSHPIIQPDYTFRQTLDEKLRIETQWLVDEGCWQVSEEDRVAVQKRILDILYGRVVAETARSREVLKRLRESFPMVLVSNFYGNISVVLEEFGLGGIFGDIIESAVVGIRKPDPRIFALGVEALGMDPGDVTVVGDSIEKDIRPAAAIGCRTVWISGETWEGVPHDGSCAGREIGSLSELLG